MENFLKVIVDLEVLHVRETKGNSVQMEKEGLIRVLQRLMKLLDIKDLTTDASTTVINLIKEMKKEHPQLSKLFHSLDIWHKAKNLTKALNKVSKTLRF